MSNSFIFFPEELNYKYDMHYLVVEAGREYGLKSYDVVSAHDTLEAAMKWILSGLCDNPYNAVIYGWDACRHIYRVYTTRLVDRGI